MKKPITMIAMLATVFGLCASTFADTLNPWFNETAISVDQAMTQGGETQDGVWSNLTDQVEVSNGKVSVDAEDETPVAYRPKTALRGNTASIILDAGMFTAARKTLPALPAEIQAAVMITTNAAGECVFAVANNGAWELTEKTVDSKSAYKVKVDLHYGVENTVDYSLDEAGDWVAFKTGAVNPVAGVKASTVEIVGNGSFSGMSGERELADCTISFTNIPEGIADITVNGTSIDPDGKATVKEGSENVVLGFVAADGYRLSSDTVNLPGPITGDVAYNSENFPVTAEKIEYVAQIVTGGGATTNKFESLGAAIDALTGGETITLIKAYTMTAEETKLFTKNATLDLGTFTLTVPEGLRTKLASFEIAKGATVTFQNGTIDLGTAGTDYGIAVLGTLNVNCTITRAGKKDGPVFDSYDGTINFGAAADITGNCDIVRVKSLRGDENEETNVVTTVTVAEGAQLKATGTGKPMFYCYKSCTTLKATLNGGAFTANKAVFGDSDATGEKKDENWDVTIDAAKAKFANDKIEFGTAVGKIIPNQKPILNQTDSWYYLQDAAKVAITADETKVTVTGVAVGDKFALGEEVAFTVTEVDSTKDVIDAVTVNGETLTAPYSWTVPSPLPASIAIVVTTKSATPDPITPGGSSLPYDTQKEAEEAAARAPIMPADNFDLTGTALTTWQGYFVNQVSVDGDGKYRFAPVLNTAGSNAVAQAEATLTKAIKVTDIAAAAEAIETMALEGAEPGFYYTLFKSADVTTVLDVGSHDKGNADKMAKADGVVTFTNVTKPDDAAGFFSVKAFPEAKFTDK